MKESKNYLASVQDVIALLDEEYKSWIEPAGEQGDWDSGYWTQSDLIRPLFSPSYPYTPSQILLRLTVIDSLYSTNGRYAQFDLETLAKEIYTLLGKSDRTAADYFYRIVTRESKDVHGFFSKRYGLNKNLSDGPAFTSLVSKYAFYLLSAYPEYYEYGFPIYDSLAIDSYPRVCRQLEDEGYKGRLKKRATSVLKSGVEEYVRALDDLREVLFSGLKVRTQQFVLLDAYLWRLGKINGGSLTLLLDQPDFVRFVRNADMEGYTKGGDSSDSFDIVMLHRCRERSAEVMLRGVEDEAFCALYRHWREYFV